MIPKQIFFVWIGNNQPKYVNFAINAFKEINSDFKIDLIKYSLEDINNYEKLNDQILKDTIYSIIKKRIIYNYGIPFDNRHLIQHICDSYRNFLIEKYGGIYLDCDTFPVKPFDNEILSKDKICYDVCLNPKRCIRDSSFFGSVKGFFFKKCFKDYNSIGKIYPYKFKKNSLWKKLKQKFLNCELKYPESYLKNFYFDHYYTSSYRHNFILEKVNLL